MESHHEHETPFKRIGIIGAGSMGSMMSLGLAEKGHFISLWDVNSGNVRSAMEKAQQESKTKYNVEGFFDIRAFADSFGDQRKLIILSISHGKPADEVLKLLNEAGILKPDDIVLDGGNEHWRTTERRQKTLDSQGVKWIGLGVSGGYQSARRGPSLCPGGDEETIKQVLPVLEKFAAKYETEAGRERPCVEYVGPDGAGHFVKMVHNGIENGMLGAVCEAWGFMRAGLNMAEDEIGNVFSIWNKQGQLRGTYLLEIGSEICRKRQTRSGDQNGEGKGTDFVLDEVLDKVVQDDDDTEGTGYWSVMESAERHISAPTIAAAQFLRVASGNRSQRLKVSEKLNLPKPQRIQLKHEEEGNVIEDLRMAVYSAVLASYCQGLELIAHASKVQDWNIDLATCIRIWRAGCIIQSDHIADMLESTFAKESVPGLQHTFTNLKLIQEIADEFHQNFSYLKRTISRGIESDAYITTLSSTLEYLKYEAGEMLPTRFMEAEMDFFGAHGFDRPGVDKEDPGEAKKGAHHYEWRPA